MRRDMSLADRLSRAAFVGIAVGLAWGIRGDFGHQIGAMYPGAILGLAFAYVAGQRSLFLWMPILGGLSALLIATGGGMSYGVLHGYAQSGPPAPWYNYAYGFFTLFLQGGAWGVFACAAIGLLLDRKRLQIFEWVGVVATVYLAGWLFYYVLVDLLDLHINPPRSDSSIAYTGGVIGLFIWLLVNKRWLGLRGAVLGYVGFGLGMAGGRLLGNVANVAQYRAGIVDGVQQWVQVFSINHWNVMECSVGVIGGFIFAFGMLGRRYPAPPEGENVPYMSVLSPLYILGLIPLLHRTVSVDVKDRLEGWTRSLVAQGYTPEQAGAFAPRIATGLSILVLLGFVGALVWMYIQFRRDRRFAWFPVLYLSGLMVLFQNLSSLDMHALLPFIPASSESAEAPPAYNMHFTFWVFLGLMVVWAFFFELRAKPEEAPEAVEEAPEPEAWTWEPLFIGAACMVVAYIGIVIGAGFVNGEITMKSANTRWPLWSWRDGTWPGTGQDRGDGS